MQFRGILHSLVSQTPAVRGQFERLFSGAKIGTDNLATTLQKTLIPKFDTMIDRLTSIANSLGANYKLKVDTSGAQGQIRTLAGEWGNLWAEISRGGGVVPIVDPIFKPHPPPNFGLGSEHGSVIAGAAMGAIVDHDQVLRVGEHNKREAILPLEDPRGRAALARALADAMQLLVAAGVRGGGVNNGTLTITNWADGAAVLDQRTNHRKSYRGW